MYFKNNYNHIPKLRVRYTSAAGRRRSNIQQNAAAVLCIIIEIHFNTRHVVQCCWSCVSVQIGSVGFERVHLNKGDLKKSNE